VALGITEKIERLIRPFFIRAAAIRVILFSRIAPGIQPPPVLIADPSARRNRT